MKKIIAASLLALTMGATAASAEVTVGLGYGIDKGIAIDNLYSGLHSTVRVPIDFDFGLRIEPELGFNTSTIEENDFSGMETDLTTTTVAMGVYYNLWKVESVKFFAGGRVAVSQSSGETTYTNGWATESFDADNTSLQALFGAEYFFVEKMSLGAQVGLEHNIATIEEAEMTSTGTVAHLVIRYFF